MIDPDIIYAQCAVARDKSIDLSARLFHNMYEIALVAHWIAVELNLPGRLSRDQLEAVACYVVCRDTGPSPDLFLSFHEWPSQPDLEFGYSPDVYNALILLSPSNRFYELLI